MSNGRDGTGWNADLWKRIDQAVHGEALDSKVAARFLPRVDLAGATTVPADVINTATMTVDEGAVVALVEIWVEFALTAQQISGEENLMTGVNLATRATNLLSQGEDILIFQGQSGVENRLFTSGTVQIRSSPTWAGLLNATTQVIPVPSLVAGQHKYGENTFGAVSQGYSLLQSAGHYGAYALVLQTDEYADTYAPLPSTLITPADRIKPLVTSGFYGTGTLPPLRGVMVSLGGNTMDLVMGLEPATTFVQIDAQGLYRFRVTERFALRVKDSNAIVRFEFQ
jgi:uncharacterized linocin/CFP29 family protein